MKLKKGQRVHLTWLDSAGPHLAHWMAPADAAEISPLTMESYGQLLAVTRHHVTIAGHMTENGFAQGVIAIPKFAITEARKLK